MLGGYLDSGDSSRSTTATHSRTSSEGVTPPYAVVNQVVNPVPSGLERPKTLLPSFRDSPPSPATVAPHSGGAAGAGTRETV